MKVGFIGAGKVGFSLGKLFATNGIHVTGYYNRHVDKSEEAAEFTGSKCFTDLASLVENSDMVFITVTDGAITSVYEQLKSLNLSGKFLCHASGAMTSKEAFPDIEKYNAYGYSIHPLFPVSDRLLSFKELSGAFFCIEGDALHIEAVKELLKGIGLKVRTIEPDGKIRYHAACAIASNLYCALMAESVDLLRGCGFSEEDAIDALSPLVRANMNSILENGVVNALTGPVERCDVSTVKKHLECFETSEERQMYLAVSKKLLSVALRKHPTRDYAPLEELLERD